MRIICCNDTTIPDGYRSFGTLARGGSRTAATSKVELFVIIVNGWKPLTIITKRSTLDVAAVLDPPLLATVFLIQNDKLDRIVFHLEHFIGHKKQIKLALL